MRRYLGSCAVDRFGCGTILIGTDVRKGSDGYEVFVDGDWIECYDVVEVYGDVRDVEHAIYKSEYNHGGIEL